MFQEINTPSSLVHTVNRLHKFCARNSSVCTEVMPKCKQELTSVRGVGGLEVAIAHLGVQTVGICVIVVHILWSAD